MKYCLVVGKRSFSPAKPPRSSPPGAVLFCRALEHQRGPAFTLNTFLKDEALGAVNRERGIGVSWEAGRKARCMRRVPSACATAPPAASTVRAGYWRRSDRKAQLLAITGAPVPAARANLISGAARLSPALDFAARTATASISPATTCARISRAAAIASTPVPVPTSSTRRNRRRFARSVSASRQPWVVP